MADAARPDPAIQAAGLDPASEGGRERVRLAIENFGIAFFESDLLAGRVTLTPNAFTLFGLPTPACLTVERSPFWACYHPDDAKWARATFEADLRGDRGRDTYREVVRIIRQTDRAVRHIEFSGTMFGLPGARTHIVGMLRDVTEALEAEERSRLLLREVHHRANNALAVVQALMRLTDGDTVEEYQARLGARVMSLARAQAHLDHANPAPVAVSTLIEHELAAWREGIVLDIAAVPPVAPEAVQPVAMILHELATNAAKHGALSVAGGKVTLQLHADAAQVVLVWREQGGPSPDCHQARQGTGMRVIGAQLRRMGGTLDLGWTPGGLCARLRLDRRMWEG